MDTKLVKTSDGTDISLGLYQHYKGDYYKVLGLCRHSETTEEFVHYQAQYGNYDYWVRPVKMFLEHVVVGNRTVPRFKLIDC